MVGQKVSLIIIAIGLTLSTANYYNFWYISTL